MNSITTKEPQYQMCLDLSKSNPTPLGLMSNQVWHDDPKRLGFVLARYKFVAKMLSGYKNVLEVGCADAFASRLVKQEVQHLTVSDFDPVFIDDVKKRIDSDWPMDAVVHNFIEAPTPQKYNAVYSVDVLEHIQSSDEGAFLGNIAASLDTGGVCIVGTPSLESQIYASEGSKAGHVNCKTAEALKSVMSTYFQNVFIFGMNDEVLHTGYARMSHYLFALACGVR